MALVDFFGAHVILNTAEVDLDHLLTVQLLMSLSYWNLTGFALRATGVGRPDGIERGLRP